MRFSILVPVYNVEKYLPECLESIKKQSYQNFEVILVDDGSSDNSGKICDLFAKELSNISVLHTKNQGLISARRIGIANAHGDYCVFCDSDDFIEINALEELSDVIDVYNPDLIIFNAFSYDGLNKEPFFEHVLSEGLIENKMEIYDKLLMSYSLNSLCLKAVKREIIDSEKDYSNFYQCNLGEDLLQSVPLLINASKLYYLDRCLYTYRTTSGMMHKYNPNYYWSYRKVNLAIREQLAKENIEGFEDKISYHLLSVAYGGTTQIKYLKKNNNKELDKICNDEEFQKAYSIVWSGFLKKRLNFKQKVIIYLLKHRIYFFIRVLLKIRSKI